MATAKTGGSKSGSSGSKAAGGAKGKSAAGDAKKSGRGGAANPAFMKPLTPSKELAGVVGKEPLPRTEVVKKVWAHIKKNNLQDAQDKRSINADAKLRPIFGKDQVSMFEMTKLVNQHLK